MTVFKDTLMLKATNKKRGLEIPRFKTYFFWAYCLGIKANNQ